MKWKTSSLGTDDKDRYIVDENDCLIADCWPDCSEPVGLPSRAEARATARAIVKAHNKTEEKCS